MSVVVMQVISAADVEGSKNLRVYTFQWQQEQLTIVANRTNVYEVGDTVAVAQVGTILSSFDNLEIVPRKVFGIESAGMALGKVDLPLGTILGSDYK